MKLVLEMLLYIFLLDLSYFNTSLVTDMSNFLSNCKKLKEIDLSNFETTNVMKMDHMFAGCTNIEYIDISSFNMNKTESAIEMFNGITNIKYINLENVHNSKEFISGSPLNAIDNLLFSQKETILGGNNKNIGCYYNITSYQCENTNYIIIYYAVDTEYKDGFENKFRENIDFIIAEDRNKKIAPKESFHIVGGNKIEIYYKDTTIIKSLQSYFDSNEDDNVKNIKSVDFTHLNIYLEKTNLSLLFNGCILLETVYLSNLNTSKVTDMDSMFARCTSLENIDISNFDTSKVTDMNSMFAGCNQIESIDLSYFNTSLVINMSFMFSDCESLKVLDLSNFNMENVNSSESMFSGINNLRYIDIYNLIDSRNIIEQSELKNLRNLIICGRESIFEKNIHECCYYDYYSENKKCLSNNYMIVYYRKGAEYQNGFQNEYRSNISFIVNNDLRNIFNASVPLNIYEGYKIKLYFDSSMKSLESFFDINYDKNVESIISIDFTHFNFSQITDMSKMFSGCSSLESIVFPNITT